MKKVLSLVLILTILLTFAAPLNVMAATINASIVVSEDSYTEESDPDNFGQSLPPQTETCI